MNKTNIRRLIRVLEGKEKLPGLNFNMGSYVYRPLDPDRAPHCGTCACIAGHAAILEAGYQRAPRGKKIIRDLAEKSHETAARWLGLSQIDANKLFFGWGRPHELVTYMENITKEHAVAALKLLLKTGEVDWRTAIISVEHAHD